MKTAHDNLDKLKEKNPFTIPKGYMEGLTESIMSQLPEPVREVEVKPVTFFTRIKPFFYMAAMFAGLGLFFKFFMGAPDSNKELATDSLLVQSATAPVPSFYTTTEEDADYLDYVEEQCSNYLLEGEVDF